MSPLPPDDSHGRWAFLGRVRLNEREPAGFTERLNPMKIRALKPFDEDGGFRVVRPSSVLGRIALVMLLAGCGSSGSPGVDGPVMRYPERSSSQEGMAAEVRGVLELDGECLYVALDEVGERYPVVWPAGTRWDADAQVVVPPQGESMGVGDEVYGGGGYLYVEDVERIAGSQASALAAECVDNAYGEIAVVNNSDTAIGPTGS